MAKIKFSFLFLLILSLIYCNPGDIEYQEALTVNETVDKNYGDVDQLIRDSFRIDIKNISVDMEYYPEAFYVDCQAEVSFKMYEDDTLPIIHLEPAISDQSLVISIELNGESLDINSAADVEIIQIEGSAQSALEFKRALLSDISHTLKITYRKNLSQNYLMFASQVSDLYGNGNETVFPTINRPGELAVHHLRFKVNSQEKFRFIGSGLVQEVGDDDQQVWTLDTEREIASYTIMFTLLPESDTDYEVETIDGVEVRVMAFKNDASITEAFNLLRPWLPELRSNLGPFPMNRGLSIMLMNSGGGMEYFGATISSLWALQHEVFHMYYACSTVSKTYRDSWLDEAVTEWYANSALSNISPINTAYRSNIVSGRSPIAIGFDGRAYNEGAQMLEHIAINMGSRQAMVDFFSYIHKNYSFKPFTTMDFVGYLKDYSGLDYEENFKQWLFYGETVSSISKSTKKLTNKHQVIFDPPNWIIEKYKHLRAGVKK